MQNHFKCDNCPKLLNVVYIICVIYRGTDAWSQSFLCVLNGSLQLLTSNMPIKALQSKFWFYSFSSDCLLLFFWQINFNRLSMAEKNQANFRFLFNSSFLRKSDSIKLVTLKEKSRTSINGLIKKISCHYRMRHKISEIRVKKLEIGSIS